MPLGKPLIFCEVVAPNIGVIRLVAAFVEIIVRERIDHCNPDIYSSIRLNQEDKVESMYNVCIKYPMELKEKLINGDS